GPDDADPTTLPQRFHGVEALKAAGKYRLGVFPDCENSLQPGVRENYLASLEIVKEFAETAPVELPDDLPFDAAAAVILSAETASAFDDMIGSEEAQTLADPDDRFGGVASQFLSARDYIHALRVRAKAVRRLDEWLQPFDALFLPTMAAVAPPVGRKFSEYFHGFSAPGVGGPGNLAGLPCLCLPNGFGERGLPTGVQFVGRALTEGRLLRLGVEVQRRTDWHRKHPKV
ncbi:MAG: amidase family protein, partial [Planctomycetia bacterium]